MKKPLFKTEDGQPVTEYDWAEVDLRKIGHAKIVIDDRHYLELSLEDDCLTKRWCRVKGESTFFHTEVEMLETLMQRVF